MSLAEDLHLLQQAGTATLADLFDTLGMLPPVLDNALHPFTAAIPFAGPAYTVSGQPETFLGGDRLKLEAIDHMPAGVVAIWAGNGVQGVCCFGDLLATSMRARGVTAAVVDGGVRDTAFLHEFDMPVFARYRTPAQGIGRWKVHTYQQPVELRGALTETVAVHPGDLIVGDRDGILVIPASLASEIAARADAWSRAESGARSEIAQGLPLLEALARYGHL